MKIRIRSQVSRLIAAIVAAGMLNCPHLPAQAPPPITAADANDYKAAEELFNAGKFKEAADRFEKFIEKYKMLSPRSLDAKFRLAISYVQQGLYDDAIRHLRQLLDNPKVDVAAKEMAQLLIAKSLTLKGFKFPSGTDDQKKQQKKVFAEAIKEYDGFLTTFPKSRDIDSALFLRATLLLQSDDYDEAVKGFSAVAAIPSSPFYWEAVMWVGKTFFIQGSALLEIKGGKEPKPEDVQAALALLDKSLPVLAQVYKNSGDIALQNDAVFFVGQIQLTKSQHVTGTDDEQEKKAQAKTLRDSLEAFRSVRSVEEVVAAQDAKIKALEQQIQLLRPGTVDYLPLKTRIENLINHEEEKKEKFKTGQDQYLAARLAIARIFLFLKETDEARMLIRHLQGQKELLEKDKEGQATLSALLCLTYAEQKNAAKALETYQEFRKQFKGNINGDNLPLLVANVLVEQGDAKKAEQIVTEGRDDYKNWRFTTESTQVLTAAALKRGDYKKALELCNGLLSGALKPDVEAQTLFIKGSVQQAEALTASDAKMADAAITTFKVLRDKFPDNPQSEDAWFNTCQILSGRDPAKAVTELQAFLGKFAGGAGKSGNTKTNLPTAQYLLGSSFYATNQKDKAVEAWRKLIESQPESDPAPGAYFKIFDVYNERKDFPSALKLMEEFVRKYPKHENVYFAYNNIAEFLFAGSLDNKTAAKNQPPTANVEAGTKKLLEYVDYELSNNLEIKRGDGSLIKIADRWLKELAKLPPYLTQNPNQRAIWQQSVDTVTSAVERLLKDYPESERLQEGLERLVSVENARRKAQLADAGKIEAHFKDLIAKYGSSPLVKAKIDVALASILEDTDPKRAFAVMEESFRAIPEPLKAKDPSGGPDRVVPSFTPTDFDRYIAKLFDEKKYDDVAKVVARVRLEYPLGEKEDPGQASPLVRDGQAVALFWQAKLLQEQGKPTDAGSKFSELKDKFPKSSKALEADYGVILGEFERTGTVKEDYIKRLNKIIGTQTGKSFELQAKALFLVGRLQEANKDFDGAVETYSKIQNRFASVPSIAAEGLWRAAEIAEKQAKADPAFPVRTKQEKRAAAEARAAAARAASSEEKPQPEKPAAPAPADAKPAPEKPAGKTTAAVGAPQK